MPAPAFLRRVTIRNYKSIGGCDVRLQPLTFLVGPNASGKSNFLDALRFVADALRTSLDHALRERGGIAEVRRRSRGHPTHFGLRLEFATATLAGSYGFEIGARRQGGHEVQTEVCRLVHPLRGGGESHFHVESGAVVRSSIPAPPAAASDRLYLVTCSGLPEFREAYDALSRMGFYNLNPDRIRDLQAPDAGDLLTRDGGNLASVLARISKQDPATGERIQEYLRRVVPDIVGVEACAVGPRETLQFRQRVAGDPNPWRFFAANMSDGTLRALGVLVALFQGGAECASRVPLIGIEEPEAALHPGAAGALLDALREGSTQAQVIVTSHSPELLESPDLRADSVLAVSADAGNTRIGELDGASRDVLRERLYSVGELLRLNQLQPAADSVAGSDQVQLNLFELPQPGRA